MYKSILLILIASWLCACNDKSTESTFTLNGTITNNVAKTVYMEEVPAATQQPMLVDSAIISADGKFTLKASPKESVIFNLRFDKSMTPVASLINDVPNASIEIKMNKENTEFADSYEVSNSPASKQMRDFIMVSQSELQKYFIAATRADSLIKSGAADSLIAPLLAEKKIVSDRLKSFSEDAFKKANDPALLLLELGYYQGAANGYGLQPIDNEGVSKILAEAVNKFPNHGGLNAIHKSMLEEEQRRLAASWVGKQAPDFTLPDVNGKNVSLSSFKGKYVLVDFWASWCRPCRAENPNVVNAYNQYKDKNFTVLGVSLDRPGQKDQWVKAIKADNLTWTHVSDLQYWNSMVIPLYKFEGIPFNVLVDPGGKVIAEALRGPNLEAKLAEVLH